MRRAVSAVGAVVIALTSCSGADRETSADGAPDGIIEGIAPGMVAQTGDVLASVDGVGALYSGEVDSAEAEVSVATADPSEVEPPAGAISMAPGLHVDVANDLAGRFEVRLELPAEPSDTAVPGVVHVGDDGIARMEPALWSPETNEVVVWADDFSARFGAWFDPRSWFETAWRGVRSAADSVADWATGRTNPPPCRNDAPDWSRVTTNEASSVHVCLQANPAGDGTERVELFVKSNRNTAQLVTLPAGADYVWVEDQPDWLRPVLAGWAGRVDGGTNVLLPGTKSMSIGFRQPTVATDVDVLAYRTWPLVVANPILGVFGDVPWEGSVATVLAVQSCVHRVAGVDLGQLDVAATGYDRVADLGTSIAECVFDLVAEPETAVATFDEMLNAAGVSAVDRNRALRHVRNGLDRIAPLARRLNIAVVAANVVTNAWDGIFDGLADGRITLVLRGTGTGPGGLPALEDDALGPLTVGMPLDDALASGWLGDEVASCAELLGIGTDGLEQTFTLGGPTAPDGLRGVVDFFEGRLVEIRVWSGALVGGALELADGLGPYDAAPALEAAGYRVEITTAFERDDYLVATEADGDTLGMFFQDGAIAGLPQLTTCD